jgi:aminoglycoside 2''-phosphotransferase
MSPSLAGALIAAQFPQLVPATVRYLGEGYDSWAFDVNGEWVFRFPKRPDVEAHLLIEMRVLPLLARGAPVAAPDFSFSGRASADFPRQFAGYRKIVLAQFLSWLHAFPTSAAAGAAVPQTSPDALLHEIMEDALGDFERVRQVAPGAPLDEWHAYLRRGVDSPARVARAALVHGDLAAEHILLDPETSGVTGVIDWSDVSLGDPAVDIAGLFHWGGDRLVAEVLSLYSPGCDRDTLSRARFIAACRGAADVTFGIEMHRPEYVRAGIRALELCVGT